MLVDVAVLPVVALEPLQDLSRGHPPLLQHRLPHGGQADVVRHLVVVDADDRELLGHPDPRLAGGVQDAEGHLVAGAEDRGRSVGTPHQLLAGVVAALEGEPPLQLQARVGLHARLAQRRAVALQASTGRGEVEPLVAELSDVGDAPVAELEQVGDRGAGDGVVVDADRGPLAHPGPEGHHGHAVPGEPQHLLGRGPEADHDQRVGALGDQLGQQHAAARVGVAADVVEQHVVAALAQHLLGAVDDGREEPPRHEEDHDRDRAGLPAAGQPDGVRGGHVAQPQGGIHDLGAGLLRDPRQPAQRPGDGRGGHPGLPCEVVDAGHRRSSRTPHPTP